MRTRAGFHVCSERRVENVTDREHQFEITCTKLNVSVQNQAQNVRMYVAEAGSQKQPGN